MQGYLIGYIIFQFDFCFHVILPVFSVANDDLFVIELLWDKMYCTCD